MDERIESFLADVLALEGEDENAVRHGVRVALADYEQIFRAHEVNKRMKDNYLQGFAGAEESNRRALAWIEQSLAPLLAGPATAIAGPVIVHTLA